MEGSLKAIGATREELRAAIELALLLTHTGGAGWWGATESKTQSDDLDEGKSELLFCCYRSTSCPHPLPVSIHIDELTSICWEWLKKFKADDKMALGDGSIGSGWALETGSSFSDFKLKIKFQTMYYGK